MSEDEEFERGNAQWRAEVQIAVERRDIAALQKLSAPLGTMYDPPIPQTQNAAGTKTEVSRRALTARINRFFQILACFFVPHPNGLHNAMADAGVLQKLESLILNQDFLKPTGFLW